MCLYYLIGQCFRSCFLISMVMFSFEGIVLSFIVCENIFKLPSKHTTSVQRRCDVGSTLKRRRLSTG